MTQKRDQKEEIVLPSDKLDNITFEEGEELAPEGVEYDEAVFLMVRWIDQQSLSQKQSYSITMYLRGTEHNARIGLSERELLGELDSGRKVLTDEGEEVAKEFYWNPKNTRTM